MTEHEHESANLEREAMALWAQYGFLLRGPVREFLKKLAAHLNWENLRKELK